ncbi:hypothetical protein DMP17_22070 [Pseudonocardia sp. TMWB2A]|uniref:hypothetical protein n=1 Tax=Pseudonocardia sp. TMWB2A TaxID=687430 RepID=UPI00307E1D87
MSAAETKARLTSPGEYGVHGSVDHPNRAAVLLPGRFRNRRRCPCGCGNNASHAGMANGVCLTSGCELSMRRWVKDARAEIRRWNEGPSGVVPAPGQDGGS